MGITVLELLPSKRGLSAHGNGVGGALLSGCELCVADRHHNSDLFTIGFVCLVGVLLYGISGICLSLVKGVLGYISLTFGLGSGGILLRGESLGGRGDAGLAVKRLLVGLCLGSDSGSRRVLGVDPDGLGGNELICGLLEVLLSE